MGVNDEIHMKPSVLWGFMILIGAGNLAYTARSGTAVTETAFSATEGRALREQVAALHAQVDLLTRTGPVGVMDKLDKVQGTVDGCMICHMQKHKRNGGSSD